MDKGRLEAFTDGVIAIIITIVVLEVKVPPTSNLAGLEVTLPVLLAYALSFANVGIFWNNHHHMLHATRHVDGKVLWANLFLLFWMSLLPFAIRWMDEAHFDALSTASYGVVLAGSSVGYIWLERAIIACNGQDSVLARAVGDDTKSKLSLAAYLAAIPLAFVSPWIALGLYVASALMWLVPDRRIEDVIAGGGAEAE